MNFFPIYIHDKSEVKFATIFYENYACSKTSILSYSFFSTCHIIEKITNIQILLVCMGRHTKNLMK